MTEEVKIIELLSDKISGEWGEENTFSGTAVNIIRTTNFTNSGLISFNDIVKREVEPDKAKKKCLQDGDVIIEKSGGGPNQPVGRVVYFQNPSKEIYLCNNFTTLLRPLKTKVSPKYLFYLLQNNYATKKVSAFQNKTTGIINLQLDRYLESKINFNPDLETQNKIVAILDKAKAILDKREKSIQKYDELLNATFLEMFGDPCNPNRKDLSALSKLIPKINSGWSPVCEEIPRSNSNQKAILKQGAVSKRFFDPTQNKLLPEGLTVKKAVYADRGNLLFSRKNTPELVGSSAYVFQTCENLLLPDTIFNLRYDVENVSGVYLHFLFNNREFRKKIQKLSVGQAKSMSNISQERLFQLEIPCPDLSKQKQFEDIVLKSYYSFFQRTRESQTKLEDLLKSLSQQVFSERANIDVDIELEALINSISLDEKDKENKIETIKNDVTFLQRLIDKLQEQDFENSIQYEKAKYIAFRIMKEESNLIKQHFSSLTKKVTLEL